MPSVSTRSHLRWRGCSEVSRLQLSALLFVLDPHGDGLLGGNRCHEHSAVRRQKSPPGWAPSIYRTLREADRVSTTVWWSGRTMARTGLRMMPTFPSSPLRFRTAGFPQYGSKAGLSDGACPCGASVASLGLRPSFVSSAAYILLALCRGSWLSTTPPCERFDRPTPGALAPVRVIVSRSIIT